MLEETRAPTRVLAGRRKVGQGTPIQNTVVQSIELQGKRGGTGKSRQKSRGTGIAKLARAAPLMEAPL